MISLALRNSKFGFSPTRVFKHFSAALDSDFGGTNVFEYTNHLHEISAIKKTTIFQTIKVFSINIGGRAGVRLSPGHFLREYINRHKPDVFVLLETQTIYKHKVPELPGYVMIFKKALKTKKY